MSARRLRRRSGPPPANLADGPPGDRPSSTFDVGLQHERTALAWERTAIAAMVAGIVFARFAALEAIWWAAAIGLAQTAFGAALLVWAGVHYEELHGELRAGNDVVHPRATRLVGVTAVAAIGLALVVALFAAVWR
jgi:putative membrane protein